MLRGELLMYQNYFVHAEITDIVYFRLSIHRLIRGPYDRPRGRRVRCGDAPLSRDETHPHTTQGSGSSRGRFWLFWVRYGIPKRTPTVESIS